MAHVVTPREPRLVWRPGPARGHVESFFLKANDPSGNRAIWIKFTLFEPRGGPATVQTWAVWFDAERGHTAIMESFPVDRVIIPQGEPYLGFGPSGLEPGRTWGVVRDLGREISWRLRFTTGSQAMELLPWRALYRLPFPRFKLWSPWPDETFHGRIVVGSRTVDVCGWPGMMGHNWGPSHSPSYVWCQCNRFSGVTGCFEGVSARLGVAGLTTPDLTALVLRVGGRELRWRSLRHWLTTEVSRGAFHWEFSTTTGWPRLDGRFHVPRELVVGLGYPNPRGPTTHCLNSKLASGKLRLTMQPGAEPMILEARGTAALEFGTLGRDHGVEIYPG